MMHKGFILMEMLLSLCALEQGNKISLTSTVIEATGTCGQTWLLNGKILEKNCDLKETVTFYT